MSPEWEVEPAAPDPDGPMPTLADVGAQLWARTVDDEQESTGEFTENTAPTKVQAQKMLDQAYEDVRAVCVQGEIPERSYPAARRAITLRAAYLIELSYFPEQTTDTADSAYLQLRAQYEAALATFIRVAQLRDAFGAVDG